MTPEGKPSSQTDLWSCGSIISGIGYTLHEYVESPDEVHEEIGCCDFVGCSCLGDAVRVTLSGVNGNYEYDTQDNSAHCCRHVVRYSA